MEALRGRQTIGSILFQHSSGLHESSASMLLLKSQDGIRAAMGIALAPCPHLLPQGQPSWLELEGHTVAHRLSGLPGVLLGDQDLW